MTTFLIYLISAQLLCPYWITEAAISPSIAEVLCERGMSYYHQGNYQGALREFKKALLANTESDRAKYFIYLLTLNNGTRPRAAPQPPIQVEGPDKEQGYLAKFIQEIRELEKSIILGHREVYDAPQGISQGRNPKSRRSEAGRNYLRRQSRPVEKPLRPVLGPVQSVIIDLEKDEAQAADIQTNKGERLRIKGINITRFLAGRPELLKVTRQNSGELLLEPQEAGVTYLHVWEGRARKTLKFDIYPAKFQEELKEEYKKREEEARLPRSFKFSYSIEADSFMTGPGFRRLERENHTWTYTASLRGETPYGQFDSSVQANRDELRNYRVSNLRMGITEGHYDQFKDITLRWFDFNPNFTAFGFPGSDLRGIMLDAPMADKKFHHTSFWGAILKESFTGFSGGFERAATESGLQKTKRAWLEGTGLNYKMGNAFNFKTFYVRSRGPERIEPVLTDQVTGFGMDYHLGRFNFGSSLTHDMIKHVSYTADAGLSLPKARLSASLSNAAKNFASLLGGEPQGGFSSWALGANFQPDSGVVVTNTFSATRDKLFGNPDKPDRPNFNYATRAIFTLDSQTDLECGYTLDDQMGSNSPSITETKDIVFRKKIFFIRQLRPYVSYQNRKNKNFNAPAQDFNNNRILLGASFRVISDIYAFYNREFNLLRNKFSGATAAPWAQETGLNYYHRISDTPFYLNARIFFRDEERTESPLSFLSGEDRLEVSQEIVFKPDANTQAFISGRIANIWAEKEGAAKHLDLDVSLGLRFLWDTGWRWQAKGNFDGFVFYDLNGDGIRQADEQGVSGVEILGPAGRKAQTNEKGYFKLSKIYGRLAVLRMNPKTLPRGYNSSTSAEREVEVVEAKTKRVDFGLAARLEVSGLIFNDKNKNGSFDSGEETMEGIGVFIDDHLKTVSNLTGEYMFRRLSSGEHVLKLDLKSLPVKFIPKVPVFKKIKLIEGQAFIYNIPLEESK